MALHQLEGNNSHQCHQFAASSRIPRIIISIWANTPRSRAYHQTVLSDRVSTTNKRLLAYLFVRREVGRLRRLTACNILYFHYFLTHQSL